MMKKIALLAMLMLTGCQAEEQKQEQPAPAEMEAPYTITCARDWGLMLTGRDIKDFYAAEGHYHIYTMDGYEAWVPINECYIRTTKSEQETK